MAKMISTPYTEIQNPSWAGDFLDREHLLPGGATLDLAAFSAIAGVAVTTTAEALTAAVAIPVSALAAAIPSGTVLRFGSGEYAKLTAAAAAGAVSLTVEALAATIESGDIAYYNSLGSVVQVPNGTLVGRTFVERAAGADLGPADVADDEIFIVAFDVDDATNNAEVDLYRHTSLVKENYLPGWTDLSAGLKAKVRALYQTTLGVN